ncbi:MAG: TolC family protein [Thermoanaerobaculia bacterium]
MEVNVEVLLKDPEIDLLIALGAVSSHAFCCRENLPKPVIAATVIDHEVQNLPYEDGRSGVPNLNYLVFPRSVENDIERFREIVPFERLTVAFNRWFTDVVPGIRGRFAEVFAAQGLDFDFVSVGPSVDEALAAIPADTEAVYLAPLLHFSDAERQRFVDGLADRDLPTFSLFGVDEVERFGVFAGQRDQAFWDRLARRVALNVQRILLGEDAGEIPVAIPDRHRLTINMETARKIDVYPPWDVLTEADLLHEEPQFVRSYSLDEVAEEAIRTNLDLAAGAREVAAGALQIPLARALLRPQIDVALTGLQIDDDRASAVFGQAERTWTGGLTLTQLIYSDPALANVAVQQHLQLSREQQFEQLRLDIARDAAVAYLNVLLAETVEGIRRNNLVLTRSNLELARVRQSVGSAGPGEAYRWESEVATARRDLVNSWTQRFQARIALNRLLHRPLEEGYQLSEVALDDPAVMPSRGRILPFIVTPRHFEAFREFSVREGLSRSPELRQLDAAIAAQERVVASARRIFWNPEIALQAELEERLDVSGAGSVDTGPPIPGVQVPDDTSWSFALRGSLPLWAGGSRRAELQSERETLARLQLDREALRERLEQLIRSNLYVVNSSYAGIRYTREASAAADDNLELVTDAYSRGAVDVLDLLDAQNAALNAELSAASALYDFFIDLLDVERSINWFTFLRTPQERQDWFQRLEKWFADHHLQPQPQLVRF